MYTYRAYVEEKAAVQSHFGDKPKRQHKLPTTAELEGTWLLGYLRVNGKLADHTYSIYG